MCINHCKWPRFYEAHSHFTSVPFLIAVLFANLLSPLVSLVSCFYSLHSASLKSVTLLGKYSTSIKFQFGGDKFKPNEHSRYGSVTLRSRVHPPKSSSETIQNDNKFNTTKRILDHLTDPTQKACVPRCLVLGLLTCWIFWSCVTRSLNNSVTP